MTANNGTYYIDTTLSGATQLNSKDLTRPSAIRNINVFAKGQTYYVFFLFAKKDTKQTYQIYVGDGVNDDKAINFKGVKISPKGWPMDKPSVTDWTTPWVPHVKDGILTVNVDFTKVPATEIDPGNTTKDAPVLSETCKPASFCSRTSSNACECDETKLTSLKFPLSLLSPGFKNVCERICKEWAIKDLDCPKDGCRGFQFTLPGKFEAKDQYRRPNPVVFPTTVTSSPWSAIVYKPTSNGGDCNYSKVPEKAVNASCKVVE
jgi:hypothetical protein